MSNYRIETKCIQSGWEPKNGEPRILPIIQSTTFKYESSDEMGALFDLEKEGYFYSSRPAGDRAQGAERGQLGGDCDLKQIRPLSHRYRDASSPKGGAFGEFTAGIC